MSKGKIAALLVLAVLVLSLVLAACGGKTAAGQTPPKVPISPAPGKTTTAQTVPKGPVSPTWIETEVSSGTTSISLAEVQNNIMSHFTFNESGNELTFMAYIFNDKLFIRADICPPCRSKSFSLVKDTLVCDACGTVFEAKTGSGISGACVSFPKAEVGYEVIDSRVLLNDSDLLTAYQDTLNPGRP